MFLIKQLASLEAMHNLSLFCGFLRLRHERERFRSLPMALAQVQDRRNQRTSPPPAIEVVPCSGHFQIGPSRKEHIQDVWVAKTWAYAVISAIDCLVFKCCSILPFVFLEFSCLESRVSVHTNPSCVCRHTIISTSMCQNSMQISEDPHKGCELRCLGGILRSSSYTMLYWGSHHNPGLSKWLTCG